MHLFTSILGVRTKIPVAFFAAGFLLFGCVNDLEQIQQVSTNANVPDEQTQDLYLHYTDSGYARIQVYARLAETYAHPERVTKLKDFVKIDFFSENGKIVSTLTALYGEVNLETGIMFVRDSVILRNLEDKQTLETEELFYNQGDSTVYTQKYVVIRKEGQGIVGRGKGIRTTPFGKFKKGDIFEPEGRLIE
ncbi:MAG: LPS export ABC transporter periplasmic protein LptC [Bacteroidetes bacterium RIFCSPHIGHO2_02_FULL_44_7]|nr:MAG: LPS export ABC transporter periplasmic protein LptC [Bacteroidetes bacterium RIFCSPHIGHO2_02_FULL_44_7]